MSETDSILFDDLKDDVVSALVDMGYKASDARVTVNLCGPAKAFDPLFREALTKMTTARGSGRIQAAPQRTTPPPEAAHGESGRRARITRARSDDAESKSEPAIEEGRQKCACAPDCQSLAMIGRQFAWGHRSKGRREARTDARKRTLLDADSSYTSDTSKNSYRQAAEPVALPPVVPLPTGSAEYEAPAGFLRTLNNSTGGDGFREISLDEFSQMFTRSGVTLDPWVRSIVARIKALPIGGRAFIELPKGKSAGGFRDTVGRQFKKAAFVVRIFSSKENARLIGIAKEERTP